MTIVLLDVAATAGQPAHKGTPAWLPLLVFGRDVTVTGISLHRDGLRGYSRQGLSTTC